MPNILGMGWIMDLLLLGSLAVLLAALVIFWLRCAARAKRFGYGSTAAYLRAAPGSDAEKRDAADLALKGVVFCGLGALFPPFILIGLIPLFYGSRKLVYALMGLGLVDDADQPRA